MRLLLPVLLLAWSTEAAAQRRPGDPGHKSETTAMVAELLFAGAGHFYTGETKRGFAILGGSVGAIVAGGLISGATSDLCEGDVFELAEQGCKDDWNWTPLLAGVALALGIRVWGVLDADDAARRRNAKPIMARLPVQPLVAIGSAGVTRVGVRVPVGIGAGGS